MKWNVLVRVPQSEALAVSNRMKRNTIWISVLGPLAILAGAYWLARSFSKPINSTITTVKAAAEGDYSARPEVLGTGELQDMNTAVETLLETL